MILYIYSKDGKVTARSELFWTQQSHDDKIAKGHKHTATINAKEWIEFLCNECEDLSQEVKSLREGEV